MKLCRWVRLRRCGAGRVVGIEVVLTSVLHTGACVFVHVLDRRKGRRLCVCVCVCVCVCAGQGGGGGGGSRPVVRDVATTVDSWRQNSENHSVSTASPLRAPEVPRTFYPSVASPILRCKCYHWASVLVDFFMATAVRSGPWSAG